MSSRPTHPENEWVQKHIVKNPRGKRHQRDVQLPAKATKPSLKLNEAGMLNHLYGEQSVIEGRKVLSPNECGQAIGQELKLMILNGVSRPPSLQHHQVFRLGVCLLGDE